MSHSTRKVLQKRGRPATVVVLDDDATWRDVLARRVGEIAEPRGATVRAFATDAAATAFVRSEPDVVLGYVQDLNRTPRMDNLEGIRFFNEVIDVLTPSAKTLIVSAWGTPETGAYLARKGGERIRLLAKQNMTSERLRPLLEWLLTPTSPTPDVTSEPGSDRLLATIELITPPCEELRRRVAREPDLLHRIDPRAFELLVAEIYRDYGWDVELTARTKDGGFDIVAIRKHDPTSLRVLVEAKRFSPARRVGVEIVRALYGVRTLHHASQVVLATSSYVSRDAKRLFSTVVPWELDFLERDRIIEWCKRVGNITVSGSWSSSRSRRFRERPDA